MKRLIVALAALALVAPAQAARHDKLPLHVGSSGPRVADLQWLLAGKRPNIYRRVKPTYRWDPKAQHGYFGKATLKAAQGYKWRLGFPVEVVRERTVGRDLPEMLQGKRRRPIGYIVRAAKRLKAVEPATLCSRRIAEVARSQIGVVEQPLGSNRGPRISYSVGGVPSYQSTTGAYGAAWCVSFAQAVMIRAGVGSFADRSAGVFYVVGWAHRHGYLNAKPKVGSLVAFTNGQGHMGVVVKTGAGWFVSTEGNSANRVRERFWRLGQRSAVFVYLPFPKSCR